MPYFFVNFGNTIYFLANDDNSHFGKRWQLWKTDGTTAGTVKIMGFSGEVSDLTVADSKLYLVETAMPPMAQSVSVWCSDGTAAGTSMVRSISTSSMVSRMRASGTSMYFTLGGGISGGGSLMRLPRPPKPIKY